MNFKLSSCFVAALTVGIFGASTTSFAQQLRETGGALFGESRNNNSTAPKSLDLAIWLGEAYDSDAPEQLRTTIDPLNPQSGGFYTSLLVGGSYNWQGDRVQIGATGGSAFRYFGEFNEVRTISHAAGFGAGVRLPKRITLLLNQTAAYSPSYMYGLFPQSATTSPGDTITAAPDYASGDSESYGYSSVLALTKAFNPRTSVSLNGDFQYTDFITETTARSDVKWGSVRAGLSRNLTRYTALVAGYRYRSSDLGFGVDVEHGVDVGMHYGKPLSATRRAEFTFLVGASSVDSSGGLGAPDATNVNSDSGVNDRTGPAGEYRLFSAEATLKYEFQRTWEGRAVLRRGVEYVMELTEPVLNEGLTAGISGLLSRQVEFSASGGYSKGQSVYSRGSTQFDTYTGNVRLRRRLSGNIAAYIEYLYYFYDFGEQSQLAPGLPPRLERHGARVGLSLWVPLLGR